VIHAAGGMAELLLWMHTSADSSEIGHSLNTVSYIALLQQT
jgi:hypothetical protein